MKHYRIGTREIGGAWLAVLEIWNDEAEEWETIFGQLLSVDENGWCEAIPYLFMERVSTWFGNHISESHTITFDF